MRTVVSVSMEPEMATRLKDSAAERGQSFSARVCELLESGEAFELLDAGLFTPTFRDDGTPIATEVGEKSGAGSVPADEGSAPESSLPADSPDVIGSEARTMIRAARKLLHDPSATAPPEDASGLDGGDKAGEPAAAEIGSGQDHAESISTGTVEERVYDCISAEKIFIVDIAEKVGIEEVEAGAIIERLLEEGEPIIMRRVEGRWACWLS